MTTELVTPAFWCGYLTGFKPNNACMSETCFLTQSFSSRELRPVAEELPGVMPPGRTWKEQGPRQKRHGPYTQIQPTPKKVKPQQERRRFKVQALSRLDAMANEGLRAIDAELATMAWARNQQIWLRLDQPHSTRMHCEIVDNHGEPLLMSNQELYSVMVQINWTLKT